MCHAQKQTVVLVCITSPTPFLNFFFLPVPTHIQFSIGRLQSSHNEKSHMVPIHVLINMQRPPILI